MRVLIHSPAFFPSVGGLEFMARMLAEELTALGCAVDVVTRTTGPAGDAPYAVFRNPTVRESLRLIAAADAVLFVNVSLRGLAPFLAVRRPWIVSHQTHYDHATAGARLRSGLKRLVARHASNVACSRAVARSLPPGTEVIPNAYDDSCFRDHGRERARDVIFAGRLVSDKGADLLIEGLRLLRAEGKRLSATIVGFGPEEARLRAQCTAARLDGQVVFAGKRDAAGIAALLNTHRVMVVPSRVEPFGIVALEGIACGCVVVGSAAGGLPEAIGRCGLVVRPGDAAALAQGISRALADGSLRDDIGRSAAAHLAGFSRRAIAARYYDIVRRAIRIPAAT